MRSTTGALVTAALLVLAPAAGAQWQPRIVSHCEAGNGNGGGNGVSVGVSLRCVGYTEDGQPLYVVNGKRNGGGGGSYERTVQVNVGDRSGPARPGLAEPEPQPPIPPPLFILVYRFHPDGTRSFEFQHFDQGQPPKRKALGTDINYAGVPRPRIGELP